MTLRSERVDHQHLVRLSEREEFAPGARKELQGFGTTAGARGDTAQQVVPEGDLAEGHRRALSIIGKAIQPSAER